MVILLRWKRFELNRGLRSIGRSRVMYACRVNGRVNDQFT